MFSWLVFDGRYFIQCIKSSVLALCALLQDLHETRIGALRAELEITLLKQANWTRSVYTLISTVTSIIITIYSTRSNIFCLQPGMVKVSHLAGFYRIYERPLKASGSTTLPLRDFCFCEQTATNMLNRTRQALVDFRSVITAETIADESSKRAASAPIELSYRTLVEFMLALSNRSNAHYFRQELSSSTRLAQEPVAGTHLNITFLTGLRIWISNEGDFA